MVLCNPITVWLSDIISACPKLQLLVRQTKFPITFSLGPPLKECEKLAVKLVVASSAIIFNAVDGANPAIGTVGSTEEVIEERIEISCEDESLSKVISIIQEVHPYEEPVIDIYKLENK
jgi:uncharacterized protein involved in tolerance to divalent cations